MSELSFFKSLTLPKNFWPWKKEVESVLGIDFGSSSIKMTQLRRFKEKAILETYGELASGPYAGVEVGRASKLDEAKAKEAILDLIKEAGIKSKDAVVSVPMHSSFVTVIEMPLMSERELAEAIKFEARRYVPVPIADVTLDWWVIPEGFSPNPNGGGDEGLVKKKKFMSVLLVAIHKEILDKYRSILKSAGLQVLAFEIEIFSATRSLLGNDLAPVLMIDAGASSAKITAVDYGIVRMVYAYERGSQEISEILARSLNVNFARAEELKRVIGLSDKPEHQEIKSIIEPLVDRLLSEAGRALLDYRRKSGRSISRVIIYGGGGLLKGLTEKAAERFGLETSLGQPFNRLEFPSLVQPAVKEVGPSFATAIGLALRGLK
jgi:type IV pilus assembly protein PilM